MDEKKEIIIEYYRPLVEKAVAIKDTNQIISLQSECVNEILRIEFEGTHLSTDDIIKICNEIRLELLSPEVESMILDYYYQQVVDRRKVKFQ